MTAGEATSWLPALVLLVQCLEGTLHQVGWVVLEGLGRADLEGMGKAGLEVLGKVGLEGLAGFREDCHEGHLKEILLLFFVEVLAACLLLQVQKGKEGEAAVVLHQAGTDGGKAV